MLFYLISVMALYLLNCYNDSCNREDTSVIVIRY